MGAGAAVDGGEHAHLLEAVLQAARRQQRRAGDALGDQAGGVVAEGDDGVVLGRPGARLEARQHRCQARVVLADLIDAVPALERRHPLRLGVAELEGGGHDARRIPAEARKHRPHENRRIAVAEVGEAVGALIADLRQRRLEIVRHLRGVRLDEDIEPLAGGVPAEVGGVLDAAGADLVDHADGLEPLAADPGGHQRRLLGEAAVAEVEAVLAEVAVGAGPGHRRHAELVDGRRQGDRVVGDQRADGGEGAGVDQPAVAVDAVLRLQARQADRLLDQQLDRPGDHLLLVRLVEGEAQHGQEVGLGAHVHVDQHADLHRREGEAVRGAHDSRRSA